MSKRVTVMFDDEIERKLRVRQAKAMITTNKNYSFSQCVNDVLRAGFRGKKESMGND